MAELWCLIMVAGMLMVEYRLSKIQKILSKQQTTKEENK